jgi:hypothetical protein
MSPDSPELLEELLDQAGCLEDGAAKVALLEEAVRLADSRQDLETGFRARQELIRAATFSGHAEKTLVAFSWCLAQCDRHPEQFDEQDLHWQYKWVVHSLSSFPQISRAQIDAMLEDMTRRYQRVGLGERAVLRVKCKILVEAGNREAVVDLYPRLRKAARDRYTDCATCERSSDANVLFFLGELERGLEEARPVVNGSMRCSVQPHFTLANVLLPLLRLGRVQEAMQCHRRGFRLVARNSEFLEAVGEHLGFLALTDNLAKGVGILEKHLPWALETMCLDRRFEFYLGTWLLLARMADTGRKTVKLRLPRAFPNYQENARYEVVALKAWVDGELEDLAGRFDARNGNQYFRQRIADNHQALGLLTPCPLRAPREPKEE